MQVYDARLLRGAAVPTTVVGVVLIALSGLFAGFKGVIGSAFGVFIVVAFFSITLVALGRVPRSNPIMMFNVVMLTYLVKIAVLGILLFAFLDTTVFNTQAFAWSIFVCTIVWLVTEVWAFNRLKLPYVDVDADGERT